MKPRPQEGQRGHPELTSASNSESWGSIMASEACNRNYSPASHEYSLFMIWGSDINRSPNCQKLQLPAVQEAPLLAHFGWQLVPPERTEWLAD